MTTKVFVGNLSFKTKEDELERQFAVAGKVIKANIITRGPRSLGYGFVELENEAVANKAVELLHKKEIDGRQINVEVAKPREEGAEQEASQSQQPSSPRGGRGGARGGFRGGFRGRGRGRGGVRGGRGRGGFRGGSQAPQYEESRVESTTTLFVRNLPFTFTEEQFLKLFTDKGLKPKNVKIITAPNQRSKGFGFVEFDNEAAQKDALSKLDGIDVEGRPLSVKIALVQPEGEANNEDKPAEEKKTEKPKEEKPKEEKPKEEKPKEDKPKEEKPKSEKPKEEKPKGEKKPEKEDKSKGEKK